MSQSRATSLPEIDRPARPERPGWIPDHITENWDPDPYAYQTEEELMPAGGLHGRLLTYVTEVLRVHLARQGQMLLVDSFLLYRDANGIKQRIGPDLLLMEDCDPPPSAYDLDHRAPPRCAIEITSPDSHLKDLKSNVPLYFGLGVDSYLVIDAVTPRAQLRDPVALHLWRRTGRSSAAKVRPDARGYLRLPEMHLGLAAAGRRLVFVDAKSDAVLRDSGELGEALQASEQRAEAEARRAEAEARRAEAAEALARTAFAAGEQKQALDIARRMIAEGLDPAVVEKLTGVPPATLAAIGADEVG